MDTQTKERSPEVADDTESGRVIRSVPLERLERHPANRRPSQASVLAMAVSLDEEDQLEPLLVRPIGGGERFQIISGETRYLAARLLVEDQRLDQWGHLDCEIRELSDVDALRLLAVANGARSNLDPIQRAELIERLCDDPSEGGGGLTRYDAAKAVGLNSGSAAANAVRLLKLPEAWRQRVAAGDLGESLARELLVLNQLSSQTAAAWERVEAAWAERGEQTDEPDCFASRDTITELVTDVLNRLTRPMPGAVAPFYYDARGGARWAGCKFAPDEETTAQLDVVWIAHENASGDREETPRACNVTLWDRLQEEAELQQAAESEAEDDESDDDASESHDEDGAEPAPKRPAADEQDGGGEAKAKALARRVERWKRRWVREVVAQHVQDADQKDTALGTSAILGAFLVLAARCDQLHWRQREQLLTPQRLCHLFGGLADSVILRLPRETQLSHVADWLCHFLRLDDEGQEVGPAAPDDLVQLLLTQLEVDLEAAWIDLQSATAKSHPRGWFRLLLETHDREQLAELADELGVKLPPRLSKEEALQVIQHAPRVFAAPACLGLPKPKKARKPAAKKTKKGGAA